MDRQSSDGAYESESVIPFAPKNAAPDDADQLDKAGQTILKLWPQHILQRGRAQQGQRWVNEERHEVARRTASFIPPALIHRAPTR
jgi:hypothetical protein